MMLADSMIVANIPVTDLGASTPFYRDALGLRVLEETPFSVRLGAGSGSQLSLYKRPPIERGHTVAHFEVADMETTMARLRSNGVVFEEYDSGPLATIGGIAKLGPARGAWFKDLDGNVLGLRQGEIPR